MFWDLNGATRIPRCLKMRHSAVTRMLFPACEAVPTIIRLLVIFEHPIAHSCQPERSAAAMYSPGSLRTFDSERSPPSQINPQPAGGHNFRQYRRADIQDCGQF